MAAKRTDRFGLTLVELILVLSLLVIIGAMSVPLLDGAFARSRLQHGADLLRAAWAQARLAASQSGQDHVFRYQPKGDIYQVLPLASLADTAAVPIPVTSETERSEIDLLRLPESRLPNGVVFAAGQSTEALQLPTEVRGDDSWSAPIMFHPDGTTSDAVVILTNEQDLQLRVVLRGLTGVSRVGEVGSEGAP